MRRSPLTGNNVETFGRDNRDIIFFEDICGRWGISRMLLQSWGETSILDGRLSTAEGDLTEVETRKTFALARSEVWRMSNIYERLPIFMTYQGFQETSGNFANDETILTIENMHALSSQLSLQRKALFTLENLSVAEEEIGAGIDIPYSFEEYPGQADWGGNPPSETGISYACTALEAPLVYQYLIQHEYIVQNEPETKGSHTQVIVTPDGYAEVDDFKRGTKNATPQVFFVCRFIDDLDDLYGSIIRPLGDELNCIIRRIKDIHHIDKIDDRICQEIRKSDVVLVDLTDQNFNIAFEAGYALALNKPIVWTIKQHADGIKMPFDIYTYNCLDWNPDNLEEFRENLKFRLIAAFQKLQM